MGENKVDSFRGQYYFLSNFFQCSVSYNGFSFQTVEAAFQAAKTYDKGAQLLLSTTKNPVAAKRAGRKVQLRTGWEEVKVGIMEGLLRQKFNNPELKNRLIGTGDAVLTEGNNHGDRFWGQVRGEGRNTLGILLMKIRDELKQSDD